MRPQALNEKGLTLLELCLTLLILALIVTAASPRLSRTYNRLRAKTTAEQIAGDVSMMLRLSSLTGQFWRMRIWENGRGYFLEQRKVHSAAIGAIAREIRGDWERVTTRALPDGYFLVSSRAVFEWQPTGPAPTLQLELKHEKYGHYRVKAGPDGVTVEPEKDATESPS